MNEQFIHSTNIGNLLKTPKSSELALLQNNNTTNKKHCLEQPRLFLKTYGYINFWRSRNTSQELRLFAVFVNPPEGAVYFLRSQFSLGSAIRTCWSHVNPAEADVDLLNNQLTHPYPCLNPTNNVFKSTNWPAYTQFPKPNRYQKQSKKKEEKIPRLIFTTFSGFTTFSPSYLLVYFIFWLLFLSYQLSGTIPASWSPPLCISSRPTNTAS